jgi:hypothetical protein
MKRDRKHKFLTPFVSTSRSVGLFTVLINSLCGRVRFYYRIFLMVEPFVILNEQIP